MSHFLKNILSQTSFWIVNKAIAQKYGLVSALLASVLTDLHLFHKNRNGLFKEEWFYCTREQLEKKIHLTPHEQRGAEQALVDAGFLEIRKMGQPAKNYYKINEDKIAEFLLDYKLSEQD